MFEMCSHEHNCAHYYSHCDCLRQGAETEAGNTNRAGPCTFVSLLSILGFVEFGQLTQLSAGIFFSIVSVGLQFTTSTHSQPPAVFDFRCRIRRAQLVRIQNPKEEIQNQRRKFP